jgi:hypothetical protein
MCVCVAVVDFFLLISFSFLMHFAYITSSSIVIFVLVAPYLKEEKKKDNHFPFPDFRNVNFMIGQVEMCI